MRRIQPHARTYILTGYPDFVSALEAIARQVDNYLTKPVDIPALLKALRTTSGRPRVLDSPGKRASAVIRENTEAMIERWAEETERDPHLKHLHLSRDGRIDHLPELLRQLANRIDKNPDANDKQELESAGAHGRTRRKQGYSTPLIVEESRILYEVMADTVQNNLADMDISSIVPDMILISGNLYVMLAESLRAFLSAD